MSLKLINVSKKRLADAKKMRLLLRRTAECNLRKWQKFFNFKNTQIHKLCGLFRNLSVVRLFDNMI